MCSLTHVGEYTNNAGGRQAERDEQGTRSDVLCVEKRDRGGESEIGVKDERERMVEVEKERKEEVKLRET